MVVRAAEGSCTRKRRGRTSREVLLILATAIGAARPGSLCVQTADSSRLKPFGMTSYGEGAPFGMTTYRESAIQICGGDVLFCGEGAFYKEDPAEA